MREHKEGVVTIIIGLFNVEGYLEEKRLSCILNQTWNNLEIILINDGSTDRTSELCGELAAKDPRIVLVDKPNGGLGSARNAGLDIATGEFVWFYDVDDEAELDLIEKNVAWMREYEADMIIFGAWFIYPDTHLIETTHFKERLLKSNQKLKSVFVDELLLIPNGNGFVWNKFYKRSFIKQSGIRFGNQRIQQDELFNLQLYPHAERVYISPDLLYHYFIYNSGNNRSRYIPNRIIIYESVFDRINRIRDDWGIQDERIDSYAYQRLWQGIENSILFNTFHPDAPSSWRWQRQEIKDILSRPLVRQCMGQISKRTYLNAERSLFLKAFNTKNVTLIFFLKRLFGFLRTIKHRLFKGK